MPDVCKNIEEYNPGKKRKVLIVFDHMIADMSSGKCCYLVQFFIGPQEIQKNLYYETFLAYFLVITK